MQSRGFKSLTVVAVLAATLSACQGDNREDRSQDIPEFQNVNRFGEPVEGRPISELELDTLRVMKKRLEITRDQYWPEHGGVLGTDYLEVWYAPGNLTVIHGMYTFDFVAKARKRAYEVFGRVPEDTLKVICANTLAEFREMTGRDWWHYSRIDGDQITYQPVTMLVQRGLMPTAVPREYYRWAIGRMSGGRVPLWFRDGFASVLAGEDEIVESHWREFADEPPLLAMTEIESALETLSDRRDTRMAMYNAHRMVKVLVREKGEKALANLILAVGSGKSLDEASRSALGLSWDEAVARARTWKAGGVSE